MTEAINRFFKAVINAVMPPPIDDELGYCDGWFHEPCEDDDAR